MEQTPETSSRSSELNCFDNNKEESALYTFEYSDFTLNLKDIELDEQVGLGAFSQVFKGRLRSSSDSTTTVAIKKQSLDDQETIPSYLWRELSILKNTSHPNILSFVGACNDPINRDVWIITEYLPKGDLASVLKNPDTIPHLTTTNYIQIALDIATGIQYMHKNSLLHRDIKTSNVLLNEEWRAKLCDFGMAREYNNGCCENTALPQQHMTLCGTDSYMAPELYFDEEYGDRADIFSFGIVLIELITKKHVNTNGFMMRLPKNNFQLDFDELKNVISETEDGNNNNNSLRIQFPPSLIVLAECCAAYDPEDRPSADDVVDWIQSILNDNNNNNTEEEQ